MLAVVAVVAGFLILRNITDDDDGSSDDGGITADSTVPDTIDNTIADTTTTTTEPPLVTVGASVVVANASGVPGSAGRMSTELAGAGFEMAEATNATSSGLEESIVYYDPSVTAAIDVAGSVATRDGRHRRRDGTDAGAGRGSVAQRCRRRRDARLESGRQDARRAESGGASPRP